MVNHAKTQLFYLISEVTFQEDVIVLQSWTEEEFFNHKK